MQTGSCRRLPSFWESSLAPASGDWCSQKLSRDKIEIDVAAVDYSRDDRQLVCSRQRDQCALLRIDHKRKRRAFGRQLNSTGLTPFRGSRVDDAAGGLQGNDEVNAIGLDLRDLAFERARHLSDLHRP